MSTYYDGSGNIVTIDSVQIGESVENLLSISERPKYNGYINSQGKWTFTTNPKYQYVIIPVNGGEYVCTEKANDDFGRVYVLSEYVTPKDGDTAAYATGITAPYGYIGFKYGVTLPEDARYLVLQVLNNGNATLPTTFMIDNRDYAFNVRDEIRIEHYENGVNWVQFGDSITSGYYSYWDEQGQAQSRASGQQVVWPFKASRINHWTYTNKGVGGMGWIYSSMGTTAYLAYNRIREIEDWSKYNLVTFAYGINDWKSGVDICGDITDPFTYAEDMTPTTVVESMRYCLKYIMTKNPEIKIIVISPFNCRGYQYDFGDDSTCWARGCIKQGRTLDDFADLMKAVCDEYGVEFLDMTRNSCINKANIVTLLPDGVHPSISCHALLAREMAKKLNFS